MGLKETEIITFPKGGSHRKVNGPATVLKVQSPTVLGKYSDVVKQGEWHWMTGRMNQIADMLFSEPEDIKKDFWFMKEDVELA